MLSLCKCYWERCRNPVTHKWHPSRNPDSFLWVCQEHFNFLSMVYIIETVEESKHFTTVKVIPEAQ
jgi:hypothetical protein